MPRLSRKQQQAHTRSCLMASAARVFARRGLQQASIDEVAEEAGFTKGAFYSNFKNKEELFLAMLDEHFARRIEDIDRATAGDETIAEQARQAGADFVRSIGEAEEFERLFFEFAAHAARNEEFREELVTRYRTLRERIADAYRRRMDRIEPGKESAVPVEEMAMMTFAMSNGFAMEKLLEPEIPGEVYEKLMVIFFAGLAAVMESGALAEPAALTPPRARG
jgi:AcrR family transcriptional regulator